MNWLQFLFRIWTPTLPEQSSDLDGIPRFSWDELFDEKIGQGGFGCVFIAKRCDGESIVVKKLIRQHDWEKFLSERGSDPQFPTLQAHCQNQSCLRKPSSNDAWIRIFWFQGRVSSLQEYFDYTCVEEEVLFLFAYLHSKIAEDTSLGLQYFHERNIVHLKPGNMLISNQQYCHYRNVDEIQEAWEKEAVICKLVDIGESWAFLQQTGTNVTQGPRMCTVELLSTWLQS